MSIRSRGAAAWTGTAALVLGLLATAGAGAQRPGTPAEALALLAASEAKTRSGVVKTTSTSRSVAWEGTVEEREARSELAKRGRDYGSAESTLQFGPDGWREDSRFTRPEGVSVLIAWGATASLERKVTGIGARHDALISPERPGHPALLTALLRARLAEQLKDAKWTALEAGAGGRLVLKGEWQGCALTLALDPRVDHRPAEIRVAIQRMGQAQPSVVQVLQVEYERAGGQPYPKTVERLAVNRLREEVHANLLSLRVADTSLNMPVPAEGLRVAIPAGAEVSDARAGALTHYVQGERDLTLAELRELIIKQETERAEERQVAAGPLKLGEAAPPVALVTMEGQPARLEDLKGKVVLLNWWASWCPPCNAEAPHLEKEFWQKYRDRGLVVIGINTEGQGDDRAAIARAYRAKHALTFPIWLDREDATLSTYGGEGLPSNAVIDREGKARYFRTGFDAAGLRQAVEKALGG